MKDMGSRVGEGGHHDGRFDFENKQRQKARLILVLCDVACFNQLRCSIHTRHIHNGLNATDVRLSPYACKHIMNRSFLLWLSVVAYSYALGGIIQINVTVVRGLHKT